MGVESRSAAAERRGTERFDAGRPAGNTGADTPRRRAAKGLICLITGTLTISTVPVVSKVVLQGMPSLHFSALWMTAALFYAALFIAVTGPGKAWAGLKAGWKPVLIVGINSIAWVYCYFRGVELLDPAIVAFVINSRMVWAVALGLLLLGERYRPLQIVGMGTIVVGVFIIFAHVEGQVEALGILFVLLAALFYVIGNLFVKRNIATTGVGVMLTSRFLFPLFAFLPMVIGSGALLEFITPRSALLIAAGAFIGPFLSFLLIYTALRYLQIGLHTIFQSVSVFYTAIFSFLVFGTLPPANKIVGGIVIIAGMVLIGLVSLRTSARTRETRVEA